MVAEIGNEGKGQVSITVRGRMVGEEVGVVEAGRSGGAAGDLHG